MLIYVRQHHIDNGKRMLCDVCPVALAVEEAIGKKVVVGPNYIYLKEKWEDKTLDWDTIDRVPVSDFTRMNILSFDANLGMEPFYFELDESKL